MANGYTYVAPRQQGRTFSDMVSDQKAIIQKQQAENVANQVASQRQKAQFQYKQLEKIYGFDVNGWSQDTIDGFKTRQDFISNKLKTGEYEDVASLIQDVGELSSLHSMGASDAQINQQGESDYLGWETGTKDWTQEGTEFVGDPEDRQSRNSFSRGGSRLANQKVINGRSVGMYVGLDGKTMEETMLETDSSLRREEDEAGNVFLISDDGGRTQVGGDAFSNPMVGNQSVWSPTARALGDISVDAFSVELHKNAVSNLRGKENMNLSQKEAALADALNQAFNGGSKTVDKRRVEQSALAYWEQQAGGEISWNGQVVGGVNDGLTPQELYVRDAVAFADLDQKQPQTQPRAPRSATSFETLQSNISRSPMQPYDARDGGAAVESVNPILFDQYVQNEEGETIPNPDYLGSDQVVAASIPLGSKTVRFSPGGTEGQELRIDEVQVMKNGDAVIKFKAPQGMNEDDVRAIFRTSEDESATPVEIVALASGEYAYRISNASQSSDFSRLKQAVDEAFPPLVVDGRPQLGIIAQEYKNLTI